MPSYTLACHASNVLDQMHTSQNCNEVKDSMGKMDHPMPMPPPIPIPAKLIGDPAKCTRALILFAAEVCITAEETLAMQSSRNGLNMLALCSMSNSHTSKTPTNAKATASSKTCP